MESSYFPDMNPVFKFLLMFLLIYLIGYFIVFRKWSQNTRPEASSCFISLFHGTPAAILATAAIFADKNRGFAATNTQFQNLVLDYSTAYFIADLFHLAAFSADDLLYVGHHLATLFVIVTCRHVALHGAFAVLSLLALAEVTSAFQNAWSLARARRSDVAFAATLCDVLCIPFYGLYSVVRGVFGPYFVFKMVVFYLSGNGEDVVATWVWVSWVVVVSMAIIVSVVWVSNLWIELYRERRRKFEDKIR